MCLILNEIFVFYFLYRMTAIEGKTYKGFIVFIIKVHIRITKTKTLQGARMFGTAPHPQVLSSVRKPSISYPIGTWPRAWKNHNPFHWPICLKCLTPHPQRAQQTDRENITANSYKTSIISSNNFLLILLMLFFYPLKWQNVKCKLHLLTRIPNHNVFDQTLTFDV